jgi:parallel beta-helix repeat protein
MNIPSLASRAGISFLVAAYNAPESIKERADFICTGTNDHLTIQSAITALTLDGEDRRGTIELSSGDFSIAGTIQVPGHIQIIGTGWGTKLIAAAGLNAFMFQFVPHATTNLTQGAQGIRIAHLTMDGQCVSQTAGGHIDMAGAYLCTIEHCHFIGAYNYSLYIHGTAGNTFQQNRIVDNLFESTTSSLGYGGAIWLSQNNENVITNNRFFTLGGTIIPQTAIYDQTGLNTYSDNIFTNCKGCITITTQTACTIIGNTFDGGSLDQLVMDGTNHCVVGNHFYKVGTNATSGTMHGIYMPNGCTYSTITGNAFSNESGGVPAAFIEEKTISSGNNIITENSFNNVSGTSFTLVKRVSTTSSIRNNQGYITESNGTTSIGASATTVTVNHGLSVTPLIQNILVMPTNSLGSATKYWVSNITSTNFVINVNAAPGSTATFAWQAMVL